EWRKRGDAGERARLVAHRFVFLEREHARRSRDTAAPVTLEADGERREAIAFGHRQRLERGRVEHAEDRGVDADRQRDRRDGSEAEARRLAQQPQRETEILREMAQHRDAAAVAMLLLDALDAAELEDRGAAS